MLKAAHVRSRDVLRNTVNAFKVTFCVQVIANVQVARIIKILLNEEL